MLAGAQRGDGEFGMRVRRRADVNQLNGRISEHLGEAAGGLHLGHVELERFGGAHVADDFGEIAVEIAPAGIAKSGDAVAVDLPISLEMRRGHETETDDADADRIVECGVRSAGWHKEGVRIAVFSANGEIRSAPTAARP